MPKTTPARILLDLCDRAEISASALAKRLGRSPSAIYAWSTRERAPSPADVDNIAAVLKVKPSEVRAVVAAPKKPGAPRKH